MGCRRLVVFANCVEVFSGAAVARFCYKIYGAWWFLWKDVFCYRIDGGFCVKWIKLWGVVLEIVKNKISEMVFLFLMGGKWW